MVYRIGHIWEDHWLITEIVPYGKQYRLLCVPLEDKGVRDFYDPLGHEQWVIVEAHEVDMTPPLTAWERILKDDD